MNPKEKIEQINKLHALGFNVVPLSANSKIPISGFKLKDYFNSPYPKEKLESYIALNPNCNVGIVCGLTSNLVVIDCDNTNAYNAILAKCPLVSRIEVKTPRTEGRHLYFRYPSHLPEGMHLSPKVACLGIKGLDIRANKSYIVAPPSQINGIPYEWITEPQSALAIPELPEELVNEYFSSRNKITVSTHNRVNEYSSMDSLDNSAISCLNQLCMTIATADEGTRNMTLFMASCDAIKLLPKLNIDQDVLMLQLQDAARKAGLGDSESRNAISNGFESGLRNSQPVLSLENVIPPELEPLYNSNLDSLDLRQWGWSDADNAMLFAHLHHGNILFDKHKEKWLIRKGHYWEVDNAVVAALARTLGYIRKEYALAISKGNKDASKEANSFLSKNRIDNTISIAKSISSITDSTNKWDSQEHYLCLGNGVVDLRSGELLQSVEDENFMNHLDIDYHQDAQCPHFLKYISDFRDGDHVDIAVFQQVLGMSITGTTKERLFFILYGRGSNGKGILFKVLENILGHYHIGISEYAFRKKTDIPKQLVKLVGKRIATIAEMNEGSQQDEALLKSFVAGDTMTYKSLYKEELSFVPQCKLWFSTNVITELKYSDAMKERLLVIPCTRQFKGDDIDISLIDKLIKEREGILAWLVQGSVLWYQATKEGRSIRDIIPESWKESTENYWFECDPIRKWILSNCDQQTDARIKPSVLYHNYVLWARQEGIAPENQTVFGRRIGQEFKKKNKEYLGITLKGTTILPDSPPIK